MAQMTNQEVDENSGDEAQVELTRSSTDTDVIIHPSVKIKDGAKVPWITRNQKHMTITNLPDREYLTVHGFIQAFWLQVRDQKDFKQWHKCLYVITDDDKNPLRAVTYVSNDFASKVKKGQFTYRLGGKRLQIVCDIQLLAMIDVCLLFFASFLSQEFEDAIVKLMPECIEEEEAAKPQPA